MPSTTPRPRRGGRAPVGRLLGAVSLLTACCFLLAATGAFAWMNPVNISPPTVTGTAQQGKTLTEHHGEWTNSPNAYTYQWQRCNSSGSSCSSIGGATGETYVPVAEDVGHELRVEETAYNFGAPSMPAQSAATAVILPAIPVASTAPTVTGTVQQGKTLEEHHGEWSNSPTGYTYRWQRCTSTGTSCTAIGGATNQTYVPVAEDVGHKLKVTETASNAGGSGSPDESKATAVVVPPVPTNSKAPSITGTAQQGQTLTEHHGEWTNSPTGYTYQWMRCEALGGGCLPISGATAGTYMPVAEDVGHKLKVSETASNEGGSSAAAESAETAVVVPPVPVNSKAPTVTGTAQQGKTLEEHHGEWSNSPTGYSYQWLRCEASGAGCVAIGGATGQSYGPVAEDVGHKLRVEETASNAGGSSAPAESAASAVVVPPVPVNSKAPTVTGTAQQGETLEEHNGEWSNSPTGYSYQWLRCNASGSSCVTIGGATGQSYSPVGEDVGHELRVAETASNAGGSGSAAESEASAVVVPPVPVNSKAPTVTGTAAQGGTLTEHHGEWSNSPTGYEYQWLRCDSSGSSCNPIGGATNQTYMPVGEDVGNTLRVEETASNAGGSGGAAESAASAVVTPPVPVNSKAPTVTGTAQQGDTLEGQPGAWSNSPTSYEYQWLRCDEAGNGCVAIGGATAETHLLEAEDVGHTLRLQVTASNAGGPGTPAESEASAVVVPPAPANSTAPTVTGTSLQGETLTAHHGEWTNSPTAYADQWMRCDASGNGCAAIEGATGETYVLVGEDVGHTLRVAETATNAGGTGGGAESQATAVVAAPAAPVVDPPPKQPEDPPADPPAEPKAPPAVVLSISAVRVDKWGAVRIPLACPATATAGCKGTVILTLVVHKAHRKRAVASLLCARGCRELGKGKYEAKAGQKVKVRVHIASATHHQVDEGKTVTATLTATSLSEGRKTTVSQKLALEPPHA